MSTLLKTVQAMANDMAGGFMSDKKGHHYIVKASGKGVVITLVINPKLNYRNRARLRFRRLRLRMAQVGLKITDTEDGYAVSGTPKEPAAVKKAPTKAASKKAAPKKVKTKAKKSTAKKAA